MEHENAPSVVLPIETLMHIISYVEDRGTLYTLAQLSSTSYAITQPHLYRRFGSKSLGWAAKHGNQRTAILSLMLSNADINEEDPEGQTPLHWAAQKGHANVVRLLLGMAHWETVGPVISPILSNYTYERYRAMQSDVANQLLPNNENGSRMNALSLAASHGYVEVVKLLLMNPGLDLNMYAGNTPLICALEHPQVVKLLLADDRIKPNEPDYSRPLRMAVQYGLEDTVRLFLESERVDPDLPDLLGDTPWECAKRSDHRAIFELLELYRQNRIEA